MTTPNQQSIDNDVRALLKPSTDHLNTLNWQKGNVAKAWDHIIDSCIRHPQHAQLTAPELCAILTAAGEALADRVRRQQAWPTAEWDEYAQRSLDHHNRLSNEDIEKLRNHPDLELPHRTFVITLEDLVARPITSTHHLADAAVEMENSLATYAQFCQNGNTLIYTIHRKGDDAILAALEIINTDGAWKLGQVAGPRNIRPTPEQLAIARLVATNVQSLEQKSP